MLLLEKNLSLAININIARPAARQVIPRTGVLAN